MMCVGTFTCCSSPVHSSSARRSIVSGSSVASTWILKSPVINSWSVQRTADSRKSANSDRNMLVVTGWISDYGGL